MASNLMFIFSYNAFRLGAMVFLAISLSNFIYVWLCKIWKVKIIEFAFFLNPWFSLLKKEINGTTYILGWLPLGAYIKPLGMSKEDAKGIVKEEIPFSFFSKPRAKQILFRLTPFFVWLFVLLLSVYTLKSSSNFLQAVEEMGNYILLVIKTMFGSISDSEFVKRTNNILYDKNIISFSLTLLISMYIILTPMTKIMNLYSRDEKKPHWLIRIVGFIVTIFVMYLALWKIPVFVFSFFSFHQNIIYIASFLLGLYFIGALIFVLAVILVKLNTIRL
ncbi:MULTISPECIES: RIP metalloprotease [Niastella]|uniref:Uncharacterized protein n=1 Tax=Niastella soli TaxID=2821487 RepID=A0ABS3Z3I9_9BACT|nr:hypothetical protein [Niastella soli]MBO9204205.1 hypothetical protein [Niastella soli]